MELNIFTNIFSSRMLKMVSSTFSLISHAADRTPVKTKTREQQHKYIGTWVTRDGHIRQEILPNGRYDEARGARQSAYTGNYRISGDRIKYRDDTGFTATGDFNGYDILYHSGHIFYRETSAIV